MVRKTQSGKSPKKSKKVDPESEKDVMYMTYGDTSVHKRNLCIVSFPIIFLFSILRALLYQIFVILRFLYCSSSSYLVKPRKLQNGSLESSCVIEEIQMSHNVQKNSGPGPGDPLLAKQKHHHRRAFEYISRALKIDEENEG